MHRLFFAVAIIFYCITIRADKAHASTNAVRQFDRVIIKEPRYQSTPKYCLMTVGDRGDVKVWMVEDGKRLFVDKNANGDLTDDGPPVEPSKVRNLRPGFWDFEYSLDRIIPAIGLQQSDFILRRWNYNDQEDSYGLSLSVDGQMPMYAGWFGTFWSTNRMNAPVIHLGGPFTPKVLRRKEFTVGEKGQRLSLCFINPGSGAGAESRLSIDALPRFVVPKMNIEWPIAAGDTPLRTSHELVQRCCYWEFYTTEFEVPKRVVTGEAKISVALPTGGIRIDLATTKIVVPVVAPSNDSDSVRKTVVR